MGGHVGGPAGRGARYRGGGMHRRAHGLARRRGFHRVHFRNRLLHRNYHRHHLYRTYFRGRRIRHYWGARHGYYPLAFYETGDYATHYSQLHVTPVVEPKQLQVRLIPYEATKLVIPQGVVPGGIFQYLSYLIQCPANMGPGHAVDIMIPPATVAATPDRSDILVKLTADAAIPSTTGAVSFGDEQAVPAATPFIPFQDAYVSVQQEPGAGNSILVHIPATGSLSLKHIVDAIDSWGEAALAARTQNDDSIASTDFDVDMVQVENGPRWEHEAFVDTSVPVAPRVISVGVPAGCSPGSVFAVGPELTGTAEPIHVRVPEGMAPGQPMEIVIPTEVTTKVQVPEANRDTINPNAWSPPPGMDFYMELQNHGFRMTVGVVEITVRQQAVAMTGGGASPEGARCCRVVLFIFIFLIVFGLIVGLSVGLNSGARSNSGLLSGYYDGEYCTSYYTYPFGVSCTECPTIPSGSSSYVCWEDLSVTWSSMSSTVQSAWVELGYSQYDWDNGYASTAAGKCWDDLSTDEEDAAQVLGYTELTWNYPYRC